jgi:hypothetical protein
MRFLVILTVIFLFATGFSTAFGATQFEQIKALAGDWEAEFPDGTTISITYTPISGGTAVMETLKLKNGIDMRSIYYRNGEKLMMTHYCESGNQPRLQESTSSNPNDIALSFLDITNVPSPESSSYLYRVVFHFKDADSFSQDITWMINGKESTNTWNLQRKK